MDTQFGYAVQAIEAILAPAIMVFACGLLLLGLLNRYTAIMSRIRALNEERRLLLRATALPVFVIGTAVLFAGVVFEGTDVLRAFRTIRLEVGELPEGNRP